MPASFRPSLVPCGGGGGGGEGGLSCVVQRDKEGWPPDELMFSYWCCECKTYCTYPTKLSSVPQVIT